MELSSVVYLMRQTGMQTDTRVHSDSKTTINTQLGQTCGFKSLNVLTV